MKKILYHLTAIIVLFSFSVCYAAQNKFTDIKETDWYYNALENIVEKGVIGGYPDNTFKPQNNITRAEFTKILLTSLDTYIVKGESFADTQGHWAEDIIYTAWEKFIIRKADFGAKEYERGVKYYPDKEITRIEVTRMVIRALMLDKEATKRCGEETQFTDDFAITETDKGYIVIAVENEIIKGYDDSSFKPNEKVTRAEAAQIIVNMLNAKVRIAEKKANETKEDIIERVNKTLENRNSKTVLPIGMKSSAIHEDPQTYEELIENIETLKVYPYTSKKSDNWELIATNQFTSDPDSQQIVVNVIGAVRMELPNYKLDIADYTFEGKIYNYIYSNELISDGFKTGILVKDGEILSGIAKVGDKYVVGEKENEHIYKADYIALSKYVDNFFKSSDLYDSRMRQMLIVFENPFKK